MSSRVEVHYGQRALKDWEREVLDVLVRQLDADGISAQIFTNFEMVLRENLRELDITVVIPELGIAVIEVKGGQVRIHDGELERYERGRWESSQIKNQLSAQRMFVQNILRDEDSSVWSRNRRMPVTSLFVTPHSDIQLGYSIPGIDRSMIIGKNHLDSMAYTIQDLLLDTRVYRDQPIFTQEQYDTTIEAFIGGEEDYSEFVASRVQRGIMVEELTREQVFILDVLKDNANTLILGAAGSGKTVVAVEQAVRLTREGKRVALVCYNRGLATHLKQVCAELDENSRPAFVGAIFEDLPAAWNSTLDEYRVESESFWDESVPRGLAKTASLQSPNKKFDAWVIDEAQDFKEPWWQIVVNGSKNLTKVHVHLFGDLQQEVYGRTDATEEITTRIKTPWFYAIGRLNDNLRNVRSIARVINLIGRRDDEVHARHNGFLPEFHQVDTYEDVHPHAESVVEDLINSGWAPGDIAVLNAYRRFKSQPDPSDDAGQAAYWQEFIEGNSVFYGTAKGFKGLDRPVVIACLDDPSLNEREGVDNDLYVAFGRARDELIIIGTLQGRDLIPLLEGNLLFKNA